MINDGKRRNREHGVALVVVLWMLALLAALILGFAGDTQTDILIVRNQEATAAARAIADAGVTLAILGILDPSSATRWRATGETHDLRFGGGTIRVAVQDDCGKIDLNAGPPALLAGLFYTLGLPENEANQLVAAIMTRRALVLRQFGLDPDTFAAGIAPTNEKPFLAVDEIRHLPGMTQALYEKLRPFLTVYCSQAGVNPLTAPAQVLESLPGASPDMVAAFVAARADTDSDSTALPPLVGVGDVIGAPVHIVTIVSRGITESGARFTREVVAETDSSVPVRFLSWGQAQNQAAGAASNSTVRVNAGE